MRIGGQRRRPKSAAVAPPAEYSDIENAAAPNTAIQSSSRCQLTHHPDNCRQHHPQHPQQQQPQKQEQEQDSATKVATMEASPTPPVGCCDADEDLVELEGILFVVGDALLDVCADVSQEFLEEQHLQLGRNVVATDQHKGQLTSFPCIDATSHGNLSEFAFSYILNTIFTLRASCGAVYCNRSCLFVGFFVGVFV